MKTWNCCWAQCLLCGTVMLQGDGQDPHIVPLLFCIAVPFTVFSAHSCMVSHFIFTVHLSHLDQWMDFVIRQYGHLCLPNDFLKFCQRFWFLDLLDALYISCCRLETASLHLLITVQWGTVKCLCMREMQLSFWRLVVLVGGTSELLVRKHCAGWWYIRIIGKKTLCWLVVHQNYW